MQFEQKYNDSALLVARQSVLIQSAKQWEDRYIRLKEERAQEGGREQAASEITSAVGSRRACLHMLSGMLKAWMLGWLRIRSCSGCASNTRSCRVEQMMQRAPCGCCTSSCSIEMSPSLSWKQNLRQLRSETGTARDDFDAMILDSTWCYQELH